MCSAISELNPRRSSNSPTNSKPLSEVTRDPSKWTLTEGFEGELKGLVLLLTHWVEASAEFVLLSKPHGYWRLFDHTATYTDFKKEMWA